MMGRLVTITYKEWFDDESWSEVDDENIIDFMYEHIVGVSDGDHTIEHVDENDLP